MILFSKIQKPFLALIFIFTLQLSWSQDTTIVQTFTWDSTSRSGNFDFPEDNKIYEKILMVYNMRCFDAAVGNGSIGCKEWDYSCNTFLHVPELTDSALVFSYDYQVSQNTEDYFAYTLDTHYTYYAFDHIKTEYDKIYSEQLFEVNADPADQILLNTTHPQRLQFLYTRQELMDSGFDAGEINGLALNFPVAGAQFSFFGISLANIQDSTFTENYFMQEKLQNVFFSDLNIENSGFNRLNFHTPFIWDGVSDLLIDISQNAGLSGQVALGTHPAEKQGLMTTDNSAQPQSLEFGGSWGVEIDPLAFNQVSEELTITFWVFGRPQDLPNNTTILEGFDADDKRSLNIHLPWSNSGIYWDCGNTGGSYDRISKTALPEEFEGKWNHWAFTKNANSGSMKIYLNGKLWHSGENMNRTINIHKFRLGSSVTHNLGYYGMMDEFSFWNKELDENAIRQLMANTIVESHPLYDQLLLYYNFDEGEGNTLFDGSLYGHDSHFEGGPQWRKSVHGKRMHLNFTELDSKPDIQFYRGTYDIDQQSIQEIEKLVTPQNSVVHFGIENNALVVLENFFVWEAKDSKLFSEAGDELDSYWVEPLDFLFFEELEHYTYTDSKLELLSLVTPYGNGLDLGPGGKTFTFDVTDFSTVLKGNKKLSVEFGSTQEQLDIRFLFIEGIPSRNVLGIKNIWPFARGYYDPIQKDRIFESRSVKIPANTSMAKIRSSITGHGQNGEFEPRNHRIYINGNQKVFDFAVWKECSYNPIYPQGGTWIYDRAGWCPGMATDLHELDITPYINPGSETKVDYNVFGTFMDQANYLVSNQLVLYGDPNFTLDAAIDHIVRPNSEAVEFARFNPLCSDPSVIIRNNGTETLSSLKIIYGVEGNTEKSYSWTGALEYLETEKVDLPVDDLGFWGMNENNTFYVRIEQPNGSNDAYTNNNSLQSNYVMTDVYEGYEKWLFRVRTNNRGFENQYSIVDQNGNIIVERANLANNTNYDDELIIPEGCYSFEIKDSGNDGLSFWNNPAAGSGWVSIRRIVNETVSFEKIKFESDFGGSFKYDFIIDGSTQTRHPDQFTRMSIFPNPVSDQLKLEANGIQNGRIQYQLFTIDGVKVLEEYIEHNHSTLNKTLDVNHLQKGHYFIMLNDGKSSWVKNFIKM